MQVSAVEDWISGARVVNTGIHVCLAFRQGSNYSCTVFYLHACTSSIEANLREMERQHDSEPSMVMLRLGMLAGGASETSS